MISGERNRIEGVSIGQMPVWFLIHTWCLDALRILPTSARIFICIWFVPEYSSSNAKRLIKPNSSMMHILCSFNCRSHALTWTEERELRKPNEIDRYVCFCIIVDIRNIVLVDQKSNMPWNHTICYFEICPWSRRILCWWIRKRSYMYFVSGASVDLAILAHHMYVLCYISPKFLCIYK